MRKVLYLSMVITALIFSSCERFEDNNEITSPISTAGKWQVSAYIDNSPVKKSFTLTTENNFASGADSITINDEASSFWNFKAKAAINALTGKFETKQSVCEKSDLGIGVRIMNGKILGSDSIYLEIQFEDDVTPFQNTYQIKGHRING